MAAESALDRLLARVRTVQNLVIAVSVVLAVPTGLYLASLTGEFAVGFLLLSVVGISVPAAYNRHWHERYPEPVEAGAWTVAACAVSAGVYLGFYWLLRSVVGPGLPGAAVSFVIAWGFGLLVEQVVGEL